MLPSGIVFALDILALAGAHADDIAHVFAAVRGNLSQEDRDKIRNDHDTAIGRADDRARELGIVTE